MCRVLFSVLLSWPACNKHGCFCCFQTELFGGDLSCLVSNENVVPPLVDKLIKDIEKRGKFLESSSSLPCS